MKKKFIYVNASGYDLLINVDTIKFAERCPEDKKNKTWVYTTWANAGYITIDENLKKFKKRLKA